MNARWGQGDTGTGRRGDTGTRRLATPLLAILIVFATASLSLAQQIGSVTTQQGVLPPRGTFVIRNAHIVTVTGADIDNGSILIRDGKIEAVGASVNAPAGAHQIEGRG